MAFVRAPESTMFPVAIVELQLNGLWGIVWIKINVREERVVLSDYQWFRCIGEKVLC